MTRPETLKDHIASINYKDWCLLFDMLPEIKSAKKFSTLMGSKRMANGSISLPYWAESEVVSKFFNTAYFLGIVVVFDWSAWQEGIEILNNHESDYNKYELPVLCKLLTTIIRSDKFCEGYMISCFETGVVTGIIEAMQNKVLQRDEVMLQTA